MWIALFCFLGQLTDFPNNTIFLFLFIVFSRGEAKPQIIRQKSYTSLNLGIGSCGGFYEVSPSNIYFHKDSYRFYEVKFMSLFGAHNLQIAMFWRAGEK